MHETINETRRVFHYGQRVRGKSLLREAMIKWFETLGYTVTDTRVEDGVRYTTYTSPDGSRRVLDMSKSRV